MENGSPTEEPPVKKRRIPKACAACRSKKLACDEQRPCSRCTKAGVECVYFQRPKDPHLERIERIESQLELLNHRLDSAAFYSDAQTSPSINNSLTSAASGPDANATSGWQTGPSQMLRDLGVSRNNDRYQSASSNSSKGKLLSFHVRQSSSIDVVAAGHLAEDDARLYYATFFEGCDRFVPVFDSNDTFDSVRSRNNILFDVILIFGARATHGVLSRPHERLYGLLREHTSDLVLRLADHTGSFATIEEIQALLVIATYSENGGILCDVALRASLQLHLPAKLDSLFTIIANHRIQAAPIDLHLFIAARAWYYLFVLDMILAIDGGKPASVTMQTSPRRIRSLLNHPQRTTLDIRLFAQVELNALRANAHASLAANAGTAAVGLTDDETFKGAIIDLGQWLSEWQGIVLNDTAIGSEHRVMSLNLQIQHAWALLTLHLRALTASGIENIALMTDSQRNIAFSAKSAAERHLQLLLSDISAVTTSEAIGTKPYVANFRYAMEFVWAKNAFCVLIVLRLGILLGDNPDRLIQRLSEAKEFLHELDKIGMGANVSYTRILAQTVEKCQRAVNSSLQSESERSSAEPGDFQSFIPKEFLFEWDFPGLHLCYIPLDWQDLFLDFGTTA